jgi:pyrimidine-nucleoside phosphorylase
VLVQAGGDVSYVIIFQVSACKIRHSGQCSSKRVHFPGPGEKRARLSALGAGRAKKSDAVDHAVGFVIHKKVGDQVKMGEALFTIHANDEAKLAEAREAVLAAHSFSDTVVPPLPLFYD